jgi:predicted TIM-barrel fold metal-dependent hydrolase
MHALPIVDPHQHLWDFTRAHYGWLMDRPLPNNPAGDCTPIARPYGIDDYLADTRGWNIVKTVHVDAGADPRDALRETRWLQEIAGARGYPQGIVAYAALENPQVESLLAAHCEHRNVRGIRQIINWHRDPLKTYTPHDLLHDEAWRRGFALLRQYELSFDLQIYPSQMPAAAALAARNPGTQLVLNHCGMPTDRDEDGLAAWKQGMALLAEQPNVAVKISGLAMIDRAWTPESIRPFVLTAIECFGTDRAMFASNFPVDRLYGSFTRHYNAYDRIVADFSESERRALFGGNAARIYRLGAL